MTWSGDAGWDRATQPRGEGRPVAPAITGTLPERLRLAGPCRHPLPGNTWGPLPRSGTAGRTPRRPHPR
jgi:hypothetical protein